MCEINYILYFTHHNLKGYVVSINIFFPGSWKIDMIMYWVLNIVDYDSPGS